MSRAGKSPGLDVRKGRATTSGSASWMSLRKESARTTSGRVARPAQGAGAAIRVGVESSLKQGALAQSAEYSAAMGELVGRAIRAARSCARSWGGDRPVASLTWRRPRPDAVARLLGYLTFDAAVGSTGRSILVGGGHRIG